MAASCHGILECRTSQLCLKTVLVCGQSFRWKQNVLGEWLGVISGHVWRLKQADDKIVYQVYGTGTSQPGVHKTDSSRSSSVLSAEPVIETAKPTSRASGKKVPSKLATQEIKRKKSGSNGKSVECRGAKKCLSSESDPCKKDKFYTIKTEPIRNGAAQKDENEIRDLVTMEKHDGISASYESNIHSSDVVKNFSQILYDYLQLDVDLDKMYSYWSSRDPHFAKVAGHFRGIRMLRQDPVENLLSFVCSSNNHISRISSMVEKLCTHYGDYIATVDGVEYYSFPSLSVLCGDGVESHLRELGFGYRAKFIASIARTVTLEKGGDDWVRSLRGRSYLEAKAELMSLLGVGAKVADCVCLMSLDQPGAIPVDTHVWQITLKHYLAKLNTAKSLTDKIYNEIGEFYRDLWGPYAGWAHSVLFTADLRQNKERAAKVEMEVNLATGKEDVKTAAKKRRGKGGLASNNNEVEKTGKRKKE